MKYTSRPMYSIPSSLETPHFCCLLPQASMWEEGKTKSFVEARRRCRSCPGCLPRAVVVRQISNRPGTPHSGMSSAFCQLHTRGCEGIGAVLEVPRLAGRVGFEATTCPRLPYGSRISIKIVQKGCFYWKRSIKLYFFCARVLGV